MCKNSIQLDIRNCYEIGLQSDFFSGLEQFHIVLVFILTEGARDLNSPCNNSMTWHSFLLSIFFFLMGSQPSYIKTTTVTGIYVTVREVDC